MPTTRSRSRMARWAPLWLGLGLVLAGPAHAETLRFSTVIVDAGHGGADGGSVWNGLTEKRLCLDVAQRLAAILKDRGLRVVMTRDGDTTVDLHERARIANRYRSSIYVSIHFNASRNRGISGIETFYRSSRGKVVARSVQRALARGVTGASRGITYANYKVLRETVMPAILIEAGFISNRVEAQRCGSPAHRQKLAQAIASGIIAARSK